MKNGFANLKLSLIEIEPLYIFSLELKSELVGSGLIDVPKPELAWIEIRKTHNEVPKEKLELKREEKEQ
jgi:hypothetical protein